MNLSFLKIKTKEFFILWISLSTGIGVFANDSIPNQASTDRFKNSDAYFLYSYTDVTYFRTWARITKQVTFHNKIVINNKSGVDEYAFLNISKFIIEQLDTIQVKTLKSDGTVIMLDPDLIANRQKENDQSGLENFPIPGVEPGDTIEITYMITEYLKSNELGDFVSLFNNIPCLNTVFTISLSPGLFVRYKQYNDFPDPQVLVNDTLVRCVFKMEEINGLKENEYACMPCELPYFYYSVSTKEDEIRNWRDVYNQEFNFITQPVAIDNENKAYYARWKKKVINYENDSSKYYKLNLLFNDVLENFTIEPIKGEEVIKSSGYFLKEQRLDPVSIRRLYRQILEDLNIRYWAVFARSKRLGEIDPDYIRRGEFDHIFFAFENSKGSLSFLYPHDINYKYQINEIPTSLYNTEAVIVRPFINEEVKAKDKYVNTDLQMAKVDSVQVSLIKLPGMNANLNHLYQVINCDIDAGKKTTVFNSTLTASGGLSTDLRSFFSTLDKNQEMNDFYSALAKFEDDNTALEIDTITDITFKNTTPFSYKISAQGTIKNSVTFLNDSLISISLDKLIQHNKINSDEETIDMNYYLDYSYSDGSTISLHFSRDFEILSFENYNRIFENNIGEYFFQVNLNSNNTLVIQSNYRITSDRIDKDDYMQLKELNDLVQETKNIRLLLKLL
jgi:hypothetical protein